MIPVGADGDSDPAFAPLPTMIAIRNAGMPALPATAIAIGAISAADAMFPAQRGKSRRDEEEHHRNQAGVPAASTHSFVRELVQRPVQLSLGEQECHPGESEKQLRGKAGGDLIDLEAAKIHSDDPRHRDRKDTDVELGDTAHHDRDEERSHRDRGQAHEPPAIRDLRKTAVCIAVWLVKSWI